MNKGRSISTGHRLSRTAQDRRRRAFRVARAWARRWGLSAHADYAEMLEWLRAGDLEPKRCFVTHGEPAAADALRRRLRDTFGWDAVVPDYNTTWTL
ncbi:MAG: hypothetical protein KC543_10880 [Myxococcales bacterium]|nr:hypothetical protein [Myxococcales bacterium]